MSAQIIDGKAFAASLRERVARLPVHRHAEPLQGPLEVRPGVVEVGLGPPVRRRAVGPAPVQERLARRRRVAARGREARRRGLDALLPLLLLREAEREVAVEQGPVVVLPERRAVLGRRRVVVAALELAVALLPQLLRRLEVRVGFHLLALRTCATACLARDYLTNLARGPGLETLLALALARHALITNHLPARTSLAICPGLPPLLLLGDRGTSFESFIPSRRR